MLTCVRAPASVLTILLQAVFEDLGNGNMSSEMDMKEPELGEGGWKRIFHYFIAPF